MKTRSSKYKQIEPKDIKKVTKKENKKEPKKEEQDKTSKIKKVLTIIIIIISLILIYGSLVETKQFKIKEYKIDATVDKEFNGLKIVQLSDIHYGRTTNKKELEKIINKTNELKPDIIFFTGNLIDKNIKPSDKRKKDLTNILKKLECTLYKYAVLGNEDLVDDSYKEILINSNFKILENESTLLFYNSNTPIEIIGLNPSETSPKYEIVNQNKNIYKIVLTNEPDQIDKFINYNPNLVLAGHTLGNIINLPILKDILALDNAKKYNNDYYKINNTELFVSSGIGTSNVKFRLNNKPSINFYRIYKK